MSISQRSEANAMLTWDIVNIAAIHKQVTVLGVADRRQIGGVRCTGPNVAPHAACRMKMEIQSKGASGEGKRIGKVKERAEESGNGQEMTSWQKLQKNIVHVGEKGAMGRFSGVLEIISLSVGSKPFPILFLPFRQKQDVQSLPTSQHCEVMKSSC